MPAIRNWVVQQERDAGRREDGLSNDERQELSRLRRENKQLRIERDILKKAAAWFARESDSIPDQMQERHPELLEGCSRLSADKGYDDHKLINRLWDQHQIKPIIAIRNCWQDGEAEHDGVVTKLVRGQQNVIYTYDGAVSCVCPQTGTLRSMDYGGFERDRNTLKYRCPARYSGATCKGIEQCPVGDAVRIRLDEDRRVFTPVARSSYRWQDYYDQRSAVERVNSRLAGGFRFEPSGHPRAGEDAAARHHGADDHAGNGLGAHPGWPT